MTMPGFAGKHVQDFFLAICHDSLEPHLIAWQSSVHQFLIFLIYLFSIHWKKGATFRCGFSTPAPPLALPLLPARWIQPLFSSVAERTGRYRLIIEIHFYPLISVLTNYCQVKLHLCSSVVVPALIASMHQQSHVILSRNAVFICQLIPVLSLSLFFPDWC